jgi:hypothetical protein
MTQLKVQRAILCLLMLMGIAILPLGIMKPSFLWVTLLGLGVGGGAFWAAQRITQETKDEMLIQQTLMDENIFRQELARTGRLDLARQAIERARSGKQDSTRWLNNLRRAGRVDKKAG